MFGLEQTIGLSCEQWQFLKCFGCYYHAYCTEVQCGGIIIYHYVIAVPFHGLHVILSAFPPLMIDLNKMDRKIVQFGLPTIVACKAHDNLQTGQ